MRDRAISGCTSRWQIRSAIRMWLFPCVHFSETGKPVILQQWIVSQTHLGMSHSRIINFKWNRIITSQWLQRHCTNNRRRHILKLEMWTKYFGLSDVGFVEKWSNLYSHYHKKRDYKSESNRRVLICYWCAFYGSSVYRYGHSGHHFSLVTHPPQGVSFTPHYKYPDTTQTAGCAIHVSGNRCHISYPIFGWLRNPQDSTNHVNSALIYCNVSNVVKQGLVL